MCGFRDECRLSAICLDHADPAAFYISPWLQKPALFLTYRVLFAAAVLSILVFCNLDWYGRFPVVPWGMTVSNWGFIALTVHGVWSAAVCLHQSYRAKRVGRLDLVDSTRTLHWSLKAGWVISDCSFVGAFNISILFGALLGSTAEWNASDILIHVVNSILVIIDILVSGFPCRVLHAVYPMGICLVYVIFTVVFWVTGGTFMGTSYIYTFLDYSSDPGMAAGAAVGLILSAVVGQMMVYGLVKLREAAVRCVRERSGQVTGDDPRSFRVDQSALDNL
ncbi:Hypp3375 [Branchiostoma lanceolatum]|uniref:Hypp3375 protein n=1 Tax=Branchiostoma lanceolatum TaxID=7740 RepID=A0A8K0EXQ6_BRALA|nr:Hypp3375 [Branchiostoma lanceolatum]